MKTRLGFVSNSSSSSFLIYGFEMSGTFYNCLNDDVKARVDEYIKSKGLNLDDYSNYDFEYLLERVMSEKMNLVIESPYHSTMYIGKSWGSIGDDQTGKEFKDSVEREVSKYFKVSKFGTYKHAWYNG